MTITQSTRVHFNTPKEYNAAMEFKEQNPDFRMKEFDTLGIFFERSTTTIIDGENITTLE